MVRGSTGIASSDAGDELVRELPAGHPLDGRSWEVIAQLIRDRNWIALALDDGRFAATHLTWHIERDPHWPYTEFFSTLDALSQNEHWD